MPQEEKLKMGFNSDTKKKDDGAWWMTMNDFFVNYDTVNVCRLLRRPHWTGHHANGEWYGNELPGGQTSYRNSQYQLTVKEDCTIFVNVGRPSSRARSTQYIFGTGPLVEFCPAPSPARRGKRIFDVGLTKNRLAAKLEVDRECCVQLHVKKSDRPYLIIPITETEGNEGLFFLSVFTSGESEMETIEDGKSGYKNESEIFESFSKAKSGGCFPNSEEWWKNFQYIIEVKEAGEILLVMDNESIRKDAPTPNLNLIPLGFALFKVNNDHMITFSSPGMHVVTSAIAARSTVSEFITLDVGKYLCLPFTFEKGVLLDFRLSVYSDSDIGSLIPVSPWSSHYTFSNAWTTDLSGGCVNNQKTWLNNPFCYLTVNGPGACTVTIEITQPRLQKYPIGISIFKGVHPFTQIASRIVGGKPWYQNKFDGELPGDGENYIVMASTFGPNSLGNFCIRLLSDVDVVMTGCDVCKGGVISVY